MSKTLLLSFTPGQTFTTDLLQLDADVVVGSSGRTTTEDENGPGFYRVDVSDVAAGEYRISAASGAAIGYVTIGEGDGVYHARSDHADSNSHSAADVASLILQSPSNKIVTDSYGRVQASSVRYGDQD